MSNQLLKLAWLTNIPTPYTVPLWRELSELCDLTIYCLAGSEPDRSWEVDLSNLNIHILAAPRLQLGSMVIYGPSIRLMRFVKDRPDVTVIDGWESGAALQVFALSRILRSSVILSYWSTSQSHRYRRGIISSYRRWLFRNADLVMTPGPAAAAAALEIGVDRNKIVQGRAVIDVSRFQRTESSPYYPRAEN